MVITLRVNDDELKLIKSYAKLHGVTVSDVVRTAIMERIEDELNIRIANDAYEKWAADDKKTYSMNEVMKESKLI